MNDGHMLSKSISTSTKVSGLSIFEALLFSWLVPHCDDYGRMDAEPIIVKAKLFPMRGHVTVRAVADGLKKLESVGLIHVYKGGDGGGGQRFLEILKWDDHQYFRSDRKKQALYPSPLDTSGIPTDNQAGGIKEESNSTLLSTDKEKKDMLKLKFEQFWDLYPNKVSKKKASDTFVGKIRPDESKFNVMIAALKTHIDSEQWRKDGGRYIPYPTTWLNQERWNDILLKVESTDNEKPIVPNYAKQFKK